MNLFSEPLATRVGSSTFCFQRSSSTKGRSSSTKGKRAAAPGCNATSTPLSAMAAGWVYSMTRTANGTSPLDAEAVDGEWSKSHGRHLGTPAPSQRLSHGTNDAEPASKSAEQTLWPGVASTLQQSSSLLAAAAQASEEARGGQPEHKFARGHGVYESYVRSVYGSGSVPVQFG